MHLLVIPRCIYIARHLPIFPNTSGFMSNNQHLSLVLFLLSERSSQLLGVLGEIIGAL